MERMMQLAEQEGVKAIAIPTIGAGVGGFQWKDVKKVMEEIAGCHKSADLFVVESYVPKSR